VIKASGSNRFISASQ